MEGEDLVTFTSSERKWLNKFRRDLATYPEEVKLVVENPDGSMVVKYPYSWIRMPRPKQQRRPLTSDEMQRLSDNLAKARAAKNSEI